MVPFAGKQRRQVELESTLYPCRDRRVPEVLRLDGAFVVDAHPHEAYIPAGSHASAGIQLEEGYGRQGNLEIGVDRDGRQLAGKIEAEVVLPCQGPRPRQEGKDEAAVDYALQLPAAPGSPGLARLGRRAADDAVGYRHEAACVDALMIRELVIALHFDARLRMVAFGEAERGDEAGQGQRDQGSPLPIFHHIAPSADSLTASALTLALSALTLLYIRMAPAMIASGPDDGEGLGEQADPAIELRAEREADQEPGGRHYQWPQRNRRG